MEAKSLLPSCVTIALVIGAIGCSIKFFQWIIPRLVHHPVGGGLAVIATVCWFLFFWLKNEEVNALKYSSSVQPWSVIAASVATLFSVSTIIWLEWHWPEWQIVLQYVKSCIIGGLWLVGAVVFGYCVLYITNKGVEKIIRKIF